MYIHKLVLWLHGNSTKQFKQKCKHVYMPASLANGHPQTKKLDSSTSAQHARMHAHTHAHTHTHTHTHLPPTPFSPSLTRSLKTSWSFTHSLTNTLTKNNQQAYVAV